MYNLILILLFISLVLATRYFQHLSRKLGPQKYNQHLIFEGMPTINQKSDTPFYKIFSPMDAILVGLFSFYIICKDLFPDYVWQFIVGYFVMHYAIILGSSLASTMIYKYAIQHPDQISGQTQFKPGIVRALQKIIVIQTLVPCIALAFMLPSPLIYGALSALGLLLILMFKKLLIF